MTATGTIRATGTAPRERPVDGSRGSLGRSRRSRRSRAMGRSTPAATGSVAGVRVPVRPALPHRGGLAGRRQRAGALAARAGPGDHRRDRRHRRPGRHRADVPWHRDHARHDRRRDPSRGGRRLHRSGRAGEARHAVHAPARVRLQHDGRPPRGRRGIAPGPAGRRQPRTAHPVDRHRRQPRGDHRRRVPGRRGASRPDPRPDPAHGAAHRRPSDPDPVRGRHARAPSRADGAGPGHRRDRSLVRGRRDGRGRDADRRDHRRPADPGRGSGPDRRGALEPGRERAAAHAGRRERDGDREPLPGRAPRDVPRRRHRSGHRAGAAPRRVRAVREGRDLARIRARPGDREGPGRGPRRPDLRGVAPGAGATFTVELPTGAWDTDGDGAPP